MGFFFYIENLSLSSLSLKHPYPYITHIRDTDTRMFAFVHKFCG